MLYSALLRVSSIRGVCPSGNPPVFAYYAALLPRRGPHIASHSVCPSVRPSRYHYRASRAAT